MKTVKFLAMLLAAFTLSFALASCGDDDDDAPAPGSTSTSKGNQMKIGNCTVKFTKAEATDYGTDVAIIFTTSDNDPMICAMIVGFECTTENGYIPNGTYRFRKDGLLGNVYNTKTEEDIWYYSDNSGTITVERSGSTYTFTIPSFDIRYKINEGDNQYGKTSLTYKGKITWEED